jgi:hypothetical protein
MDTAASPAKSTLQHLLSGSMQIYIEKNRLHTLESEEASFHLALSLFTEESKNNAAQTISFMFYASFTLLWYFFSTYVQY